MVRKPLTLAAVWLLLLLLPAAGLAQSTFGSITGVVTDPTGAVVPNAQVKVTNEGTGAVRTAATTSAGVFNVPNLDLGTYRVNVSASGFTTYERADFRLAANQIINVNVELQVGATSTVLEVEAATPVITTETGDISGSIDNKGLQTLPTIARHDGGTAGIYAVIPLNTGVASVSGKALPFVGGARYVSGTLPTMDGIAVMAYAQGAGPVQPSFEAIQELKVEISVAPAEFATAANFQVVSKSATNEYHGSAFYAYNGAILNARNFFSNKVAPNVLNNFGGSFGGPVLKNKLFFFADYEGSRNAGAQVLVESVPLPAWRDGNFSSISTKLVNPFTGQQFTGNVIPPELISKVSQNIQSYAYPLPNTGAAGTLANNWSKNASTINGFDTYDNTDVRVDYNISHRDTVFGRGSYRTMPNVGWGDYPLYGDGKRTGKSALVAWTHIISPAAVNEFRFGTTYHRNNYWSTVTGSSLLNQFGITGVNTPSWGAAPFFNIAGVYPWNAVANGWPAYQDNPETTLQWIDNLSWNHGRHLMKFGFDAVRDRLGGNNVGGLTYGEYDFPGTYTGFGYADFLLGIPQTVTLAIPNPSRNLRGTTMGIYAQDQFKISSRLTFIYGVRWELEGPYTDKHGLLYSFNPATGGLVVPDDGLKSINPFYPKNIPIQTASQAGYPANTLLDMKKDFIQPRIALTYKLGANTVIRSGYGIYSNLIYGIMARQQMTGGPFSGQVTYTNSIVNGTPLFSFPSPFLPSGTTATQNVNGVNPHLKTPYTQQWQISLEHQVAQWGFRASYLGSRTDQLVYVRNRNQPPPSTTPFTTSRLFYPLYNQISYADSGGNAFYNALQLSVDKKYGNNLTINGAFTWAKDLTDTQDSSAWGGQLIANQFCRACEKGNSLTTLAKRFTSYGLYRLPVGNGQRFLSSLHGPAQHILGGWQGSWTMILESGPFFTPAFSGFDPSNTRTIGGRPDVVAGVSTEPAGGRTIRRWFNPAAFKIPGCPDATPTCTTPDNIGRFGNAGIGILQAPPYRSLDFGLMKNFKLTERLNMRFMTTMVNALNHPNFTAPAANISSAGTVGVSSGMAVGTPAIPAPRTIDLGLRLDF